MLHNNKEPKPVTAVEPNSSTTRLQRYEATEHKTIGNMAMAAFLEYLDSLENLEDDEPLKNEIKNYIEPNSLLITLNSHVQLTAGEWVALAGDFFGIPEKPISGLPGEELTFEERKNRFLAAYLSLANISSDNEKNELQLLLEEIRKEDKIVRKAIKDNASVHMRLHEHASVSNTAYSQITSQSIIAKFLIPNLPLAIVGLSLYTRYLELAQNNYDHFGEDAEKAYEAGHAIALQSAENAHVASKNGKTEEAIENFLKAITQELFACHFLTDLFAAGHIRVPRKALGAQVANPKLAGLLSMMMHNEDGAMGLQVTNRERTHSWLSKGDGCLYDEGVKENHERVANTAFLALQSIYDHYKNPEQKSTFNFRDHIPIVVEENNHPALFKVASGTVAYRGSVEPTSNPNYAVDWLPKYTLTKLWLFKKPDHSHTTLQVTEDEIVQGLDKETTQEDQRSTACILL